MGYSLSWLALEHADAAVACERLGLSLTSEPGRPGISPLVGCALPGGWYLVVARGCQHDLVSDAVLRAASRDRAAVAVSVEEHVMVSVAALWSGGEQRWRASHREQEEEVPAVRVAGEPPAALAKLLADAEAAQRAEPDEDEGTVDHFFEVPVLLAAQLTGFKHDDWPDALEGAFVALRPVPGGLLAAAHRPWWRFWR